MRMKGVVLAGGNGTRLAPLTKTENKHLLPVYNKKMIEYPIATLIDARLTDIIVVTGGNKPGSFIEYLESGQAAGCNSLGFTYQQGSGGVAAALQRAREFCNNEAVVVILGDNYFEDSIKDYVRKWKKSGCVDARCFLRKTDTPWHFGIAEVGSDGKVVSIEEKPSEPKSDLAILGCYLFPNSIWDVLDGLQPSSRGELEITDALKTYMQLDLLTAYEYCGFWSDMGTFDTWADVSKRVAEKNK